VREWILAEVNYGYTREHRYEVAVLPIGATEPHNLHLPYGTDNFEATIIGEHVCEAAHRRGARVVLLPTVNYGTETNMIAFPLAMNLNPSTLAQVIGDLVESLDRHGILKVVILNGHGGNDFKPVLRELYGRTRCHLFLCDWFRVAGDRYGELFAAPGDHADEVETSFALAYFPDLVAREKCTGALAADEGAVRTTRFEALNQRWVSITRPWHLLTTNTGVGNPFPASREKGEALMKILVERLAGFLVDLSASPLDETFPY
jgi:creatinine amidohydrolase